MVGLDSGNVQELSCCKSRLTSIKNNTNFLSGAPNLASRLLTDSFCPATIHLR